MKEHSGGSPEIGIESQPDGAASPVAVVQPTFPHDSFIDLLRDHCLDGGDVWDFVARFFEDEIRQRQCDLLRKVLQYYRAGKKLKLLTRQLLWISGASMAWDGESLGNLARKSGVSKQAFEQGAEKLRAELFSIRSQTRRSDDARQRMSKRTPRRVKYE